jgi:hypothetical protein
MQGAESSREATLEELRRTLAEHERRLAELERRLARRAALAGPERVRQPAPSPRSEPSPVAPEREPIGDSFEEDAIATVRGWTRGLPARIGRTTMVLGGAFALRALTESGTLPLAAGAGVGLTYALSWLAMADRAARAGRRQDALFHGLATTVTAFPLLWEVSTRFGVLGPRVSALAVFGVGSAILAVSWARSLGALAVLGTLAATATGVALLFATHTLPAFSLALFALAAASLGASYHRDWYYLRWPAALALDALVVIAMPLVGTEGYEWLRPGALAAVQILLAAMYLGILAVRTLVLGNPMREFGVTQSLIVLAIGFEGARHVLGAESVWAAALPPIAVALAAGCYGVSFLKLDRAPDQRVNLAWYTTVGTLLAIDGLARWVPAPVAGLPFALLVVAAAPAARSDHRRALRWSLAALTLAAGIGSGLLVAAARAFHAADPVEWTSLPAAALAVTALIALGWYLLRWPASGAADAADRSVPGMVLIATAVLGIGTLLVLAVAPPLGGAGTAGADAARVAVARMLILCVAALLMAAVARVRPRAELNGAVYAILVAAGLKLAFEDLPVGRTITICVSLVLYGAALVLAPRMVPGRSDAAVEGRASRA